MAVFETNTYSNGGTALAAFEVNPLPVETGRRWRHLRLRSTLVAGRHWRRLR